MHLLFAALKSKDAAGILKPFAGIADTVHTLPIVDHDCEEPKELAEMARSMASKPVPGRVSARRWRRSVSRPGRL
jgi:dihydrofolate synthase/folylpolyglutamate synthase